MPMKGGPVSVTVGPKEKISAEQELTKKVRQIMLGRAVSDVKLAGDQLIFKLSDGGSLSINCAGGLREVN